MQQPLQLIIIRLISILISFRYIKLSSPRLNNMAVVGCILVYTAVILLGLDHATLPSKTAFPTVCTVKEHKYVYVI